MVVQQVDHLVARTVAEKAAWTVETLADVWAAQMAVPMVAYWAAQKAVEMAFHSVDHWAVH